MVVWLCLSILLLGGGHCSLSVWWFYLDSSSMNISIIAEIPDKLIDIGASAQKSTNGKLCCSSTLHILMLSSVISWSMEPTGAGFLTCFSNLQIALPETARLSFAL